MMNDALFTALKVLDLSFQSCVNSLNVFVKRLLNLIYKLY